MRNGAGIVISAVGVVFLVIGLLVGGIFFLVGSLIKNEGIENEEILQEYKRSGEKTVGVVIDTYDATTVEYEDEDGEEYSITYNMTSSEIRKGDKMTVYYDEKHPEMAVVKEIAVDFNKSFGNIFFWVGIGVAAVFGGIGLAIIIAGIIAGKKLSESPNSSVSSSSMPGRKEMNVQFNYNLSADAANKETAKVPTVHNDIPVDITVNNTSSQSDYSGIDKNLLN